MEVLLKRQIVTGGRYGRVHTDQLPKEFLSTILELCRAQLTPEMGRWWFETYKTIPGVPTLAWEENDHGR